MIPYTQSNVTPGNCWQTGVACILEVDPAELPDQVAIEASGPKMTTFQGVPIPEKFYPTYSNVLNVYLVKHHKLLYQELGDWQYPALEVTAMGGYHLLIGPTVRTPENGMQHVVVGRKGQPVWDPHPSRAGLIEVKQWGVISPTVPRLLEHWNKYTLCMCPACLEQARRDNDRQPGT